MYIYVWLFHWTGVQTQVSGDIEVIEIAYLSTLSLAVAPGLS